MAVTRLSWNELHVAGNTTDGSPTMTIDAGTDVLIVATIGSQYETPTFYSTAPTFTVGGEALTAVASYDNTGDGMVVIWRRLNPTSGAGKAVVYDWAGTSNPQEGTHMYYACYDSVDVAGTPFGTVAGQIASDADAVAANLVIATGDLAVCFSYTGYSTSSTTWTNATEIDDDQYNNGTGACGASFAEVTTVGTISVTATSTDNYVTVAAVVLKALAAVGDLSVNIYDSGTITESKTTAMSDLGISVHDCSDMEEMV